MPDKKIGLHSVMDMGGAPVLDVTYQRAIDNKDGTFSPLVSTGLEEGVVVTGRPQSALNMELLTGQLNGWFDVSSFKSASLQIMTTGTTLTSGSVVFEQTNDINASPNGVVLCGNDTSGSWGLSVSDGPWIALGMSRIYRFGLSCRYMRARIKSAIVGTATVQVTALFSHQNMSDMASTAVNTYIPMTGFGAGGLNGTIVSAAGVNLTQLKASEGRIYKLDASNTTAVWQYIKIFNKPSVGVTMGTTLPIHNLAIPPGGSKDFSLADIGIYYNGGISIAITAGAALLDNTPTTAGSVIANYAFC